MIIVRLHSRDVPDVASKLKLTNITKSDLQLLSIESFAIKSAQHSTLITVCVTKIQQIVS